MGRRWHEGSLPSGRGSRMVMADRPRHWNRVVPRPGPGLFGAHGSHKRPRNGCPEDLSHPGYRSRGQVRRRLGSELCYSLPPAGQRALWPPLAPRARLGGLEAAGRPFPPRLALGGPWSAPHPRPCLDRGALPFYRRAAKFPLRNRAGTLRGREGEAAGWPGLADPEKVGFLATSIGPAGNVPRNVPVST